jgi:hypothetical protein
MTPDQYKDKFLFIDKTIETLKNDAAACANFIKTAEEEFLKISNLSEGLSKNDALLKTYGEISKKDRDSKQTSINNLQSVATEINRNLDLIRSKISEHAERDDVLNALIEYSKKQITEICSQLLHHERKFQDLKDELSKTKSDLSLLSNQSKLSYDECKGLIASSRKSISDSQEMISKIASSNDEHIVKTAASLVDIGNAVTGNKNHVASQLKNLEEKIQKIAQSNSSESQSSNDFSAIMDSIAELKRSMEVSRLDVQNSTIRSSNTATQVQILEKKIENIYLLLKKFEINQ